MHELSLKTLFDSELFKEFHRSEYNYSKFYYAKADLSDLAGFVLSQEECSMLVSGANKRRINQFRLSRCAAHLALHKLGIKEPISVLRGKRGEPIWPQGVIGSITHSKNLAIAVVTHKSTSPATVQGIGIDLERLDRPPTRIDISKRICHPQELAWCNEQTSLRWPRILSIFSAKESIFKALYPLCHRDFGFKDVILDWQEPQSCFKATLLRNLSASICQGLQFNVYCTRDNDFLFTGTVATL